MTQTILTFLLAAIPTIIAITLHEAAHGYAAWALGDDTAKQAGRLSLNPLAHVDRMGTFIVPGALLLFQLATIGRVAFMFGWAKPVPVSAWRFRDPRRGMALVAIAGPLMNFFLAWLGALAVWLVPYLGMMQQVTAMKTIFLFMVVNLALGMFNLIPIPPLDGGRIAVGILPLPLAQVWAKLERAGIVLVVLLVFLLPTFLRDMGVAFDPVGHALDTVIPWAVNLEMRLAGHGPIE